MYPIVFFKMPFEAQNIAYFLITLFLIAYIFTLIIKYLYKYGLKWNFSIYSVSRHVSYGLYVRNHVSAGDQKWHAFEGYLPSID